MEVPFQNRKQAKSPRNLRHLSLSFDYVRKRFVNFIITTMDRRSVAWEARVKKSNIEQCLEQARHKLTDLPVRAPSRGDLSSVTGQPKESCPLNKS